MTDLPPSSEYPDSVAAVIDAVGRAVEGGQKLRCSSSPSGTDKREYSELVLQRLNKVVDYPARDMTVTVEAGMPWEELARILAAENQQLPIDVAAPAASIGAVVAADSCGPRQYGYGTLRDYVIGIEAVDGRGRTFHAGGRVVKNVAGYDLCRLMVGSRGLLGVITQVTFKLKPVAECSVLSRIAFTDAAAVDVALSRLNTSAATPTVIDLATVTQDSAAPFVLTVAVDGSQESCDWQLETIHRECDSGQVIELETAAKATVPGYGRSFEFVRQRPCLRCRPSQVAATAAELLERGYSCIGHAGNGILYVDDDLADGNVRRVCDDVAASIGAMVSEWSVDHPAANASPLTTKVRATFDPSGIFTA